MSFLNNSLFQLGMILLPTPDLNQNFMGMVNIEKQASV